MELKGKRILFLSVRFFGYQFDIANAFDRLGAEVDYFDERPSNSVLVKTLIRVERNLLGRYLDRYHARIMDYTADRDYDYIFVLRCETMSAASLERLRRLHPRARLIAYHWDSMRNNKNASRTVGCFDDVYSFDHGDVEALPRVKFKALFFLEDYRQVASSTVERDIDLLFVGTAHSDRYRIIRRVAALFEGLGMRAYTYFFFPARLLYIRKKLLDRSFLHTRMSDFHYSPLGKSQVMELFCRSRVIIDLNHPRQTGLTMRCFEVMGAKRKLITTNPHIRDYDFYDPANIMVLDRKDPRLDEEFIRAPYREIPVEVYEKYSIKNWVRSFFDVER